MLALDIPAKSADFSGESVSENPAKFDFCSCDLLEAPKIQIVENDWSLFSIEKTSKLDL